MNDILHLIFDKNGNDVRMATPLGLGKPNHLLNAIFDHAEKNPNTKLSIFTALSLAPPSVTEDLAKRFFEPFSERQWGKDYPVLKYYKAAQKDQLPKNIKVHEFYFQAGSALSSSHLQQNYQSVNYTHVAENVFNTDINVIVQIVAKKETSNGVRYSLSCNPDLTLDVHDIYQKSSKNLMLIGVVHPDLPFLEGDAEVGPEFFTAVLDDGKNNHELFALPRLPISIEDHMIGFYSSLFVKDGGTIQIGIGSLSDAIVHSLKIRQTNPASYEKRIEITKVKHPQIHKETFEKGLYGLTEMLTDSFMHLRTAGILKRHVIDESTGSKTFVHGSFFLGSKTFYQWLRDLNTEDRPGLRMTRVSKVNDLYDPKETLLRQQRVHARFFNTTMQMSLLGEAASETLPDGKVVSGVGGQYNFVSMSHELKGARSILMLRSYRWEKGGKRVSNIIWNSTHFTIPRHLRDIVVTEYGIADVRGKSDEECIQNILNITDSEFQQGLLAEAKKNKKISMNYEIPREFCQNTPEKLNTLRKKFKDELSPFPFGSDFTPEEENLAQALEKLKEDQKKSALVLIKNLLKPSPNKNLFSAELERVNLKEPKKMIDKVYQRLVLYYLNEIKMS